MYAKMNYESGARRYSGGGCCNGTDTNTFTSRSRPMHRNPPHPRYCDTIPPAEANPEMIGEIIRDLHCVFEKTYGRKANVEARFRDLASEVEELKDDLACCECCKEELENELIKLHPELKALQFALEEEIQKRACLESIINQLRAQLARADAMLDADSRDKSAMQGRIRDLEAQLSKLQDIIDCLTSEKEDLTRNVRQFDEYKVRQDDSTNMCGQRMEQLEDALVTCCKGNEELQKEIIALSRERDCLIAALEECHKEKERMLEDFEKQRRAWMDERDRLEQTISDLRKAVECLTAQNQEICDKMREVVSAHHREMDNLKVEASKYKKLYEQEKSAREKAEEGLRKCHEQSKKYQQQLMERQNDPTTTNSNNNNTNNTANNGYTKSSSFRPMNAQNPCAEILARINGRHWGGNGGGGGCGGGSFGTGTSSYGNHSSTGNNNSTSNNNQGNNSTSSQKGGTSTSKSYTISKLQDQLKVSNDTALEQEKKLKSLETEIKELKMKIHVPMNPSQDSLEEDSLLKEDDSITNSTTTNNINTNDSDKSTDENTKELQRRFEEERQKRKQLEIDLKATQRQVETEMQLKDELEQQLITQMKTEDRVDLIRLQHLEEKLKNSENIRISNEETTTELEEKLRRLQKELNKVTAERKTLEDELEVANKKTLSLEEVIEKEQRSRLKIQEDLDKAEEIIRTEIKDKESLKERVTTLEINNNNLEQNQTELLELREKLRQQEKYKIRTEELKAKLEKAEENKLKAEELFEKLKLAEGTKAQLKLFQEKIDNDKIKFKELGKLLEVAEKDKLELEEIRKQLKEAENYKKEAEELKLKYEKQAENDKLYLVQLENQLEEIKRYKGQVEQLQKQFTQQVEQDKLEIEQLHDQVDQLQKYKLEAQDMKIKLENAELKKSEIEHLREMLKKSDSDKLKIDQLQSQLEIAQKKYIDTDELRKQLKKAQEQNVSNIETLKSYKERLETLEPQLEELAQDRREIQIRLEAVIEENTRWKQAVEEERVSCDVVQRELRDVHKMWETEVKAKGLLAEKIAKYERSNSVTESKTKQEAEYLERVKEKARQLKTELKAERELSNKLKLKVQLLKEQCRVARDQLQEMANDPRAVQLTAYIETQKAEHDKILQQIGQQKLVLENEVKELKQLQEKKKVENVQHRESIEKLMEAKERLETEMLQIKTLVNKRYVEKSVLDAIRKEYEANITALKSKFETQHEQELSTKLNQIGAILDTQNRDRVLLDTVRNVNETTLRSEFNSMVKHMKLDIERLNSLLKAREEEIASLRTCVGKFKDKVTLEAEEKNELIRKLQRISSSQETNVNNNNQ